MFIHKEKSFYLHITWSIEVEKKPRKANKNKWEIFGNTLNVKHTKIKTISCMQLRSRQCLPDGFFIERSLMDIEDKISCKAEN